MITHFCDRCGMPIFKGETRYVLRMEMYAAADQPIEINLDDLLRDHLAEIDSLIEEASSMTEEELMQDVYVEYRFDLCRRCHLQIVRNPLLQITVL